METTFTLYVDLPAWAEGVRSDDFVVAVGKTKSNSVYHVASAKPVPRKEKRTVRWYLRVYRSDLLTAIRRGPGQRVITLNWYPRNQPRE